MDFAQHVGQGFGREWRGILFRRTYPELADVIEKSQRLFHRIWPGVRYNVAQHVWTWPTGESLLFRHMAKAADYYHYHGHAYPWIGWEELTTWPDDTCLRTMMSCCRSTRPGIPKKVRATTNPYGKGHNWVKRRYGLPSRWPKLVRNADEPDRIAIFSSLSENRALAQSDPEYGKRIVAAARNPNELKAWRDGSWDITSGGMFDDLWTPDVHVLPSFPLKVIPRGWKIDRSFDWGSSKPFSVGIWAQSNGEPLRWAGTTYGRIPGDLIRVAEWYGWNGNDNEGLRMGARAIATGILDRLYKHEAAYRVQPGPADTAIYDESERPGKSIAKDMADAGVHWTRADKAPGSRKQGWEQIRKLMRDAAPEAFWAEREGSSMAGKAERREKPGLFVLDRCEQFIRTVPVLSRDEKDPDDVNTESEDHVADETRYRCRAGSGFQQRDAA